MHYSSNYACQILAIRKRPSGILYVAGEVKRWDSTNGEEEQRWLLVLFGATNPMSSFPHFFCRLLLALFHRGNVVDAYDVL
jgi:hypothetical protein